MRSMTWLLMSRRRVWQGNECRRPAREASERHCMPGRAEGGGRKKTASLTVYSARGRIFFWAPVTTGSTHDSLPLGTWRVTSVTRNPTFHYDPELFWNIDPEKAKVEIAAGPNNPVGDVWIDINKPHYGIHGTPEPGRIGYTESHGC